MHSGPEMNKWEKIGLRGFCLGVTVTQTGLYSLRKRLELEILGVTKAVIVLSV